MIMVLGIINMNVGFCTNVEGFRTTYLKSVIFVYVCDIVPKNMTIFSVLVQRAHEKLR